MDKLWKVLYQIVLILLHESGSFIKKPTKIEFFVSDNVRRSKFEKEFKDE